jgi:NarL family two-component system response regulator LiaR
MVKAFMQTIRILIVDDHTLFRQGIRKLLDAQADMEVVGEASDGLSAITMAAEQAPDVVLMDIAMPGMDGLEATRRILGSAPNARVVVLTAFEEPEYVMGALHAGARGYLLKDTDWRELATAVRTIHRGGAVLSPAVTEHVLDAFRRLSPPAAPLATPDELTAGERDVLLLVAQGCENEEIAARLSLSPKTVGNRLTDIYRKLGVSNRTQAVLFALRRGWIRLG